MASVGGSHSRLPLWGAFAAGATAGGVLTGVALAVLGGLASPLPAAVAVALTLFVAGAMALLDVASPKLRLPQREILIPQEVFAHGMWQGLLRFGVEYGSGVRTLIPSASSYILAAALVLANLPWWQTVAVAAAFGFGRTLAVLLALLFGDDSWSLFLGRHSRLLERAGSVGVALIVAGAALAR